MLRRQLAHFSGADDHHRMAIERPEDFAREFHCRIADGDGHLPDTGLRSNPLGHPECTRENLFQQTADRAFALGYGVSALELTEHLRLSYNHRIEAGGNPEQMLNGIPRFETIEMPFKRVCRALPGFEKMVDNKRGLGMVRRRESDLDSIAGGEDYGFRRPQILQLVEGFGKRAFRNSQFLAQVDRRGLMADSREQQFHWTRWLSRRKCAIHVTAEQQRATIARIAALRPRQPALTRKKMSVR